MQPGKYDVIIAGAGPAGSTAAYFLAREGLSVLLLERGQYPGAKSCGGAALIAEHTHRLFPNFWDELTVERIVTDQAYWLMTEDSLFAIRYNSMRFLSSPYNRFTVKRPHLYKWLTDKAVAAGATLLFNHNVQNVIFEQTQAVGVTVSPPQNTSFSADLIILADGANSLIAESSGLITKVNSQNLSLYVKETIALSPEAIETRFNLPSGCGSVIGIIGYPTAGFNGTASIHTFTDSININVGMSLRHFSQSGINPNSLLERVKKHPLLEPYWSDGKLVEYGSQMIPEGGYYAIPELVYPGLLIVGDAAALVNGTHGFNLAMWSGFFAAQAAIAAKKSRDFSQKKLSLYKTLLQESFVLEDMKANSKIAAFEREIPYYFNLYSKMINEAAYLSAKVYTMPKKAKRIYIFKKLISMQSISKLLRDIWKTIKVIR
ncbi:hypothetical protein P22_0303 [Propionispora sp. 2/2-37]|nr:hypothetical protein P22_0303 [Propionispora sp. 2/2-37]